MADEDDPKKKALALPDTTDDGNDEEEEFDEDESPNIVELVRVVSENILPQVTAMLKSRDEAATAQYQSQVAIAQANAQSMSANVQVAIEREKQYGETARAFNKDLIAAAKDQRISGDAARTRRLTITATAMIIVVLSSFWFFGKYGVTLGSVAGVFMVALVAYVVGKVMLEDPRTPGDAFGDLEEMLRIRRKGGGDRPSE